MQANNTTPNINLVDLFMTALIHTIYKNEVNDARFPGNTEQHLVFVFRSK